MAAPTTQPKAPGARWIADEIDSGSAKPPRGGTDRRTR